MISRDLRNGFELVAAHGVRHNGKQGLHVNLIPGLDRDHLRRVVHADQLGLDRARIRAHAPGFFAD